jgi:hypothetical protein
MKVLDSCDWMREHNELSETELTDIWKFTSKKVKERLAELRYGMQLLTWRIYVSPYRINLHMLRIES